MLGDGICAAVVFLILSYVRFGVRNVGAPWRDAGIDILVAAASYAVLWVVTLWSTGIYARREYVPLKREARHVAKAALIAATLVCAILFLLKLVDVSRLFLVLLFIAAPAATLSGRALVRSSQGPRQNQATVSRATYEAIRRADYGSCRARILASISATRSMLAETRSWLGARPRLLDYVAALLVVGGGALRLYRSTSLSLWLDEGFTLLFARLPWESVLGLHGAYDAHPPLYYALVKAATLMLPELVAARYLSVLAGTATLAVLYLLVARLAGRPAALVACLVAALSPLAVWYSQEARQYAVTGLAVSIAYFALLTFYERPTLRWAFVYGAALTSALYLDYSALYALAPQLVLLPFVVYRQRQRSISIIAAGFAAAIAYLPWLPNVFETVHALGSQRGGYLEAGSTEIADSLLSIAGFVGQGVYFASLTPSPWDRWPSLHLVLGALAVAAFTLGGIALVRQRFGFALAYALSAGTVVAALLVSQISPGYAPRTVSYAVLGWAMLLGAAAAGRSMSIVRRASGWVVVAAMVVVSMASLQSVYNGDKQHWQDWAAGVAKAAQFGFPVITFPRIAPTMVDAYQPDSLAVPHLALDDVPDLKALGLLASSQRALWVATYNIASVATIDPFLRAAGFERIVSQQYYYSLSLDLYVRSGVTLGSPLHVNTEFTPPAGGMPGWDLPQGMSSVEPGILGPEITLSNHGGTEASAVLAITGAPLRLYTLTFEARSRLSSGTMRAFLICAGDDGFLHVAPDSAGAGVPAGVSWQRVTVSAFCPEGTDQVRIDLRNAGVGGLDLRDVQLFHAASP